MRSEEWHNEIFDKANIDFYIKPHYDERDCAPIKLRVHCSLMDDVIERYGTDIKTSIVNDEYVIVEIYDCVSPDFHAWILFDEAFTGYDEDTNIADMQLIRFLYQQ